MLHQLAPRLHCPELIERLDMLQDDNGQHDPARPSRTHETNQWLATFA